MVLVGFVIKPHGIRGELLISPQTDNLSRFQAESVLWIGQSPDSGTEFIVESVRTNRELLLIKLQGVDDRTASESLRRMQIFVEGSLGKPPEGGFWEHEIIGLNVLDLSGNSLGRVLDVIVREAQDLWLVGDDDQTTLVPAVEAIVKIVDIEKGQIIIDPPAGLFEEEE